VIELARALGAELQALLLEDIATLAMAELPSPRTFDARASLWRDVQRPTCGANWTSLPRCCAGGWRRRSGRVACAADGGPRRTGLVLGAVRAGQRPAGRHPSRPDPMALWVRPFTGLLEAALASPAAVLYLPHQGARGSGPIAFFGGSWPATWRADGADARRAGGRPRLASTRRARARCTRCCSAWAARVRVVVCDRRRSARTAAHLQEAGDRRLAVLLAPVGQGLNRCDVRAHNRKAPAKRRDGAARDAGGALRSWLRAATGRPVTLIQTHISSVLLAGGHAFKLKKPVAFGFVDFGTLAARKRCCEENCG